MVWEESLRELVDFGGGDRWEISHLLFKPDPRPEWCELGRVFQLWHELQPRNRKCLSLICRRFTSPVDTHGTLRFKDVAQRPPRHITSSICFGSRPHLFYPVALKTTPANISTFLTAIAIP